MFGQNIATYKIMPERLIDTYRRFGQFGPAYHIVDISRKLENGEVLMRIHVIESDEDTEYPLSQILTDPGEDN